MKISRIAGFLLLLASPAAAQPAARIDSWSVFQGFDYTSGTFVPGAGQNHVAKIDSSGLVHTSCDAGCSGGGGGGGGAVTQSTGSASFPWWFEGLGTAGTPAGGVLSVQGVASGTALPVSGTFWQTIQPISAASLPLPTGAATAANQTAVLGPVAAGAAAGNSALIGCVYTSTLPTLTNGQQAAAQCDSNARLYAIGHAQISTSSPSYSNGTNQPLSATLAGALRVDASATTQPVSIATLPALTAGSAVIGVTGVAQASTTSGQSGELIQGAVTTGNPTYTTAQTAPISLTTSGAVRTIILGGNGGTSTAQTFSTASAANNAAIGISAIYNSTPLALTNGQSTGLQQDTTGALYADTEGVKNTFSCSATVTLAATPTDIFSLVGSATKAVRLRSIRITTLATTAGSMTLQLAKRSTVDTSGTNTTPTVVPFDTNNAVAGTAVCKSWSANPTSGTLVGYIDTRLLSFPLTASQPPMDIAFGTIHGDSSLVLRGTSQELDVNLAGGTLPTGAALTITEEWTEE